MKNTSQRNRSDRKKLSWIYRKKTKLQRSKNPTPTPGENAHVDNKKARLIVRNLSFKATEDDVKRFYEPFGPVEEINLLRHPDGKPVGCGFVQFKRVEDASKAIFNTNKKEFLGRPISASWAISKSKFCEKLEKESAENAEAAGNKDDAASNENLPSVSDKDDSALDKSSEKRGKRSVDKEKSSLFKKKKRKEDKEKNRKKRSRIVIRNLSFQATEEHLREHFSNYGTIEDVTILKRQDGKSVGCAFLQFDHVQCAAKAVHYANLKPLLDRPIIVDWAVPKSKFKKDDTEKVDVKDEIKTENDSGGEDAGSVKEDFEETRDTEKQPETDEESGSDADDDEEIDVKECDESDESKVSEDEQSDDDEKNIKMEEEDEVKRPRFESHDVTEGKTVFLKNVPFSVKNQQLRSYMEKFGPVYYALVCIDPLTEFSKGTAFVKFRNVEDAEKCLMAGNELQLDDQILEAHRALERNEVDDKAKLKKLKMKDSRNLYLVKEGVILAGSAAANGVSKADMAKRLQIEQWKSQILRNLNMFVSRIRLVVHNLPASMDDAKLRQIFERHSGPKAVIREARVMRDFKNVDAKGVGKSKEYGFVCFTNHEDALTALRNINNNPSIFSPNRRPIISFSIENRIMVNAKQKRIQKSREQNPLWPGHKEKRKADETNDKKSAKKSRIESPGESDAKPYSGVVGKPGQTKLRTKFNLKSQAAVHHETVKKQKKMNKAAKKLQAKKQERQKSKNEVKVKPKIKVNPDDVHLDKLVNNYKKKLESINPVKSKWYEA